MVSRCDPRSHDPRSRDLRTIGVDLTGAVGLKFFTSAHQARYRIISTASKFIVLIVLMIPQREVCPFIEFYTLSRCG